MAAQSGEGPDERHDGEGGGAITIVIPAHGVGAMLADALDSVLAQRRGDWRAIVIDDGDARVARHVAPYLHDPRIAFLQTGHQGLPAARNHAIARATTPYVALLDGDDMIEPDYAEATIAALEANPRIGLVTGDACYFGLDRAGELFSAYNPQQGPATLERVLRRQFNIFVAAAMRREAIAGIGGFDTALRSSEDFDAWLRLLIAGWEVAHVPRPIARYRRRPGQMSRNSLLMLETRLAATARARDALEGRPERAAAEEMCARIERDIMIAAAFERLALPSGDAAAGAAAELLALGAARHRPRLRLMLRLIRRMPFCAPFLLKLREKI